MAGYYDGDAGELVVPRDEDGFTALQRATLVHELTHALTDQHYRFNDRYTALIDEDRAVAVVPVERQQSRGTGPELCRLGLEAGVSALRPVRPDVVHEPV